MIPRPSGFQGVLLGLLTAGSLVLMGLGAQAQQPTAPSLPASPALTQPTAPKTNQPKPLSGQEKTELRALFTKLRPATLRLEQCAVNDCTDPDGIGTAFLIGGDGLALTAYHVIYQAPKLSARTSDGKRYAVTVVGYDDQHDLAVIRVGVPKGTPFLPLAKSGPKVGDAALAIGNGGGAYLQPKLGRFTALNTQAQQADFPSGTLELSAPLVPGDSGGPIINRAGEVAGVVSFIRLSGESRETVQIRSYAVPVTTSSALVAELRRGVKREAPVIGISLGSEWRILFDLPEEVFVRSKLGKTAGAFFTSVLPGSPAAKAGLQPLRFSEDGDLLGGDIVTALNNHRLKTVGLRERLKVGIRAKARHSSTIPNTLLGFGSK